MQDDPPMVPDLYPPVDVWWDATRKELVVVGTIGLGVDSRVRYGFRATPAAAKQLLLRIRDLLEIVDADARDTTPHDLQ